MKKSQRYNDLLSDSFTQLLIQLNRTHLISFDLRSHMQQSMARASRQDATSFALIVERISNDYTVDSTFVAGYLAQLLSWAVATTR